MDKPSVVEILQAAKALLTELTWTQGTYFESDDGQPLCYCSHGAVQAVVNPKVKEALNAKDVRQALNSARAAIGAAAAPARNARGAKKKAPNDWTFQFLWDTRLEWMDEPNAMYGEVDIHYLLGLVGLTAAFNDNPYIKLSDIHWKFDEAIEVAQKLK